MKADADAPAVDGGVAAVGQAIHVVDTEDAENVVETRIDFHVGGVAETAHADIGGETEQIWVTVGVIAAVEVSPESADAHHFAEFKPVDIRYVVQQGTIEPVCEFRRHVGAVDELHRVEQSVGARLNDV